MQQRHRTEAIASEALALGRIFLICGQRKRADDHPMFDIYDLHIFGDRIDTTDPGSLRRWRAEQSVRLCLGKHNGRARILRGIGELGGIQKSVTNAVADLWG